MKPVKRSKILTAPALPVKVGQTPVKACKKFDRRMYQQDREIYGQSRSNRNRSLTGRKYVYITYLHNNTIKSVKRSKNFRNLLAKIFFI
jgi:hypothetical protein